MSEDTAVERPNAPEKFESVSAPPDQAEAVRTIEYEEFDPKGTLALIALYSLVVLFMWVFMYFVEFLGNDLVVVG